MPGKDAESREVWRCRWCGRRVHGVFGWFHKSSKCNERLEKEQADV